MKKEMTVLKTQHFLVVKKQHNFLLVLCKTRLKSFGLFVNIRETQEFFEVAVEVNKLNSLFQLREKHGPDNSWKVFRVFLGFWKILPGIHYPLNAIKNGEGGWESGGWIVF